MSGQPYTILIIDDELITRMALSSLLQKPNIEVLLAEDGIQGIDMAQRLKPDVILLDVMMPHMSGYEVCKRIRSDPRIGEVPIIMITALDDRDVKLNSFMVGADDFLSKPFDSLELEFRLNTLRRVGRYRNLLNEREKLQGALAELSSKNEQLQLLSRQILDSQERERRYLAVELHDEIGQLITGLKLILERKEEDCSSLLGEARAVTNELMERVREISLDLRPSALDDLGLFAALDDLFRRFTSRTRITIHHNIDPLDERRFDRMIETAVFRVAQEALTNVARHAGVSEANVTLIISPVRLHLSVLDDGRGFTMQSKPGGSSTGLSGMQERVEIAGGRFSLDSAPGKGTMVFAEFDLKPVEGGS